MKRFFFTALIAGFCLGVFAQGYSIGSVAEIRQKIALEAVVWKGVPYIYGGGGPSGFDCSGYTQYVFRKIAGIELPRRAKDQYKVGVPVTPEKLQVGDLLVFDTIGGPSHVGIYLGDGNFSHAASEGTPSGIKTSKLSTDGYDWRGKLLGGRALISASQSSQAGSATGDQKPQPQQTAAPPQPVQQPPKPQPAPVKPEIPVSTIGFTIGPRVLKYNDPIPAYAGTKVEFNVMNKSGADAEYVILFVKGDYDAGAYKEIWSGKKKINEGAYAVTPEFLLDGIDYWQLVVKGTDGSLRGKRAFKSIQEK